MSFSQSYHVVDHVKILEDTSPITICHIPVYKNRKIAHFSVTVVAEVLRSKGALVQLTLTSTVKSAFLLTKHVMTRVLQAAQASAAPRQAQYHQLAVFPPAFSQPAPSGNNLR